MATDSDQKPYLITQIRRRCSSRINALSLFVCLLSSLSLAQTDSLDVQLDMLRLKYAPDPKIAVFDVICRHSNQSIVVSGEVDNPQAKDAITALLTSAAKISVLNEVRVLPDEEIGQKKFGVVTLSVGNVRKQPDNKKELISQVLMGTVVKILKRKSNYYFIQMPDQYLGWINESSLICGDSKFKQEWETASKVITTAYFSFVMEETSDSSSSVCDVVAGCTLKRIGIMDNWIQVMLADGRSGFIRQGSVEDFETWKQTRSLSPENLERTARSFIGIPYLWGGASVKGFDCSGFTKTVYRLNGLELARDADEQIHQGVEIEPGRNFENLKKGDLLFFGEHATAKKKEHITHVGMYLEKGIFIHSSGRVHLSSFFANSPLFEKTLLKKFLHARRIIGSMNK